MRDGLAELWERAPEAWASERGLSEEPTP